MRRVTDTPADEALDSALPVLTRAFGLGEVVGRRFLADGLMNRNWRLDTTGASYAVKQIIDVPLARVHRNLKVLPGLAGEGLPVPAALASADGQYVVEIGERGYCVLPWVEGSHVQGVGLTLDQARGLGALLGRLHQGLARHAPTTPMPVSAPVAKVADPARASEAAESLLAKLPPGPVDVFGRAAISALRERKALLDRYANRRPATGPPVGPLGWTHGDFQYRNLLRADGDVVAILDWDRVAVRPYAEEVARTAQVQFGVGGVFDLDRVAAFVSGYRSVVPLSTEELADGVDRLWWKRMTDFWQLDFHFARQDPVFGEMFLEGEALLHWWTDRLDQVQEAFVEG